MYGRGVVSRLAIVLLVGLAVIVSAFALAVAFDVAVPVIVGLLIVGSVAIGLHRR